MNLEIRKIRLEELEDFLQSNKFRRLSTFPVTEMRVQSYLNNPHAQPGDVVLYLGFIGDELVAFRTLFADRIYTKRETVRFAWCSGNWVHPGYRRKGFSEQLLNEALADWNGKLMFTNYAPNSEKLYLKTGKFRVIHQFQGIRGYLFPKTVKLIHFAGRNKFIHFLFSFFDIVISVISSFRIWFFRARKNPDVRFAIINLPDEECYKVAINQDVDYLFNRGERELKWIFDFPWISNSEKLTSINYPFSSFSKSFSYCTVKVFLKGSLTGYFIFSVRNGQLKTLHFCTPDGLEKEISGFLKKYCIDHKIEVATVYNFKIAKYLFTQKFPFLYAKKYGQKIYCSFEIPGIKDFLFQDGDGDVIFT